MTQDELTEIMSLMGTRVSGGGKNQKATCPLAPWTHGSGKDSHPSMSVRAMDDGSALFKCFTCHEQGTIKHLAWRFGELSRDFSAYEYVRRLFDRDDFDPWSQAAKVPFGGYFQKTVWMSKQHDKKTEPLVTEDKLKEWLKEIPKYALERGLTRKEIIEYEIGYDPKEKRMIIPIRDHKKSLQGVSGRDVTGVQKPKYKHYFGFKKEKVFYGEAWLDLKVKTACIVEGFQDVWNLRKLGKKNVFASMGTSLSTEQIRKLMNWQIVNITIYPDQDKPGIQFAEELCEKLVRHGIVVGVAAVQENSGFIHQSRESKWKDSDFRFKGLDEFVRKDPGDFSEKDLEVADKNVKFLVLKNNQFHIE